jgi:uncharacterized repeat protein (TIGR03987 family)
MLITAISTITLALVFYTLGVFKEHKAKKLTSSHLFLFLAGLAFDTSGTLTMSSIANDSAEVVGGINWHAITGFAAIALMAFHAIWAIIVLLKKDEKSQENFHKFSLIVWLIWLVPYVSGVFVGMN